MDSGDRAGSWISLCVTVAVIALVFLVSSCEIQSRKIDAPMEAMKVRSEYQLKRACIENRGSWTSTNNDGTPPYSCKFK